MSQTTCPICKQETIQISKMTTAHIGSGLGWENDSTLELIGKNSTLELIGKNEVSSALRFCTSCVHSFIAPKFNDALLYDQDAPAVRQKHMQYNGVDVTSFESSTDLNSVAIMNEFERLLGHASAIQNSFHIPRNTSELKVIDIGGGDGFLGKIYATTIGHLTRRPSRVDVLDPISRGKHLAHEIDIDSVVHGTYDVAILSHVLEHTYDSSILLDKAYDYLSKTGLLVVEVPDERRKWILASIFRQPIGLSYHCQHFSFSSLRRQLEAAHFESIQIRRVRKSSYHGKRISSFVAIANKSAFRNKQPLSEPNYLREFSSIISETLEWLPSKVLFKLKSICMRCE